MSFSHYQFKTLGSGKLYDSGAQTEMSGHDEEVTGEVKVNASGRNEENNVGFSPELVDERIKVSLQPLHAQICALTEIMDRLSQSTSARETATASTREKRYQHETPFSAAPGSSSFPTVAPFTTAGYSPDTCVCFSQQSTVYVIRQLTAH